MNRVYFIRQDGYIMETDMQKQLLAWSGKWVPLFNELSKAYNTSYYTQSPLAKVDGDVDVMFIGINPGGCGEGVSCHTPEGFLAGNPAWDERFIDGKIGGKMRYFKEGRFFMGYDEYRHPDAIDNDSRVVWTNWMPFASANINALNEKELKGADVLLSTVELIKILKPWKIVFLGGKFLGYTPFELLDRYNDSSFNVQHVKVYGEYEIGRVNGRPAYYVCHPTSPKPWPVSHCFTSVFIFLRDLIDVYRDGKPMLSLEEVKKRMLGEFSSYKNRMAIAE